MRFLLALFLFTSPLLANGPIELTKEEALEMMNLAFTAIAAQADAREAIGQSQLASKAYQDRLDKLMADHGVSVVTHKLNRLAGTLEPIEIDDDEEETTP